MLLEPFANDVFAVTRELRFFGVETGARTTIVRLGEGRVFVHSPGPLSPALRQEVAALGEVVAVVAPSSFHHLHVSEWLAAYPKAKFACCPDLVQKRADLRFDAVLSSEPEPEWAGELEQVYFSARTMEDEVIFFHRKSRTMICCDAIFNLRSHPSRRTRLVSVLLGNKHPGATWLEHLMMRKHRLQGREQVDRMLAWDIEGIVLSHGALIESGGREVLRRAYAWL